MDGKEKISILLPLTLPLSSSSSLFGKEENLLIVTFPSFPT